MDRRASRKKQHQLQKATCSLLERTWGKCKIHCVPLKVVQLLSVLKMCSLFPVQCFLHFILHGCSSMVLDILAPGGCHPRPPPLAVEQRGTLGQGGKKKNKQKRSELKPIKSTGKMQGGRLSLPELEFGLGAMEMKPGRWLRCTREARVQHLTLDS